MPELPEVETIVRAYRSRLEGRRIVRFVSRWAKNVQPSLRAVRAAVVGREIARVWRRAKYIVVELHGAGGEHGQASLPVAPGSRQTRRTHTQASLPVAPESEVDEHGQPSVPVAPDSEIDKHGRSLPVAPGTQGGYLLIHLRMSGRFEWAAEHEREPRHVRAYFDLDDGNRLLFCDARKFGRIIFTRDLAAATRHLGVEPLERSFTAIALERLLRGRARQLKPLLLDQSVVAGLGNIYTDEALFEARLHPATRSNRLSGEQMRALRAAISGVLRKAIRYHGTTIDWIYPGGWMQRYLKVYGRAGLPCRRCATPIEGLRIAQRGTYVCPKCQPLDGKC
jgi:formamidopyrimidine-DNA glycosylase